MYNDIDSGGLRMVDIDAIQKAIQLQWAKRLLSPGSEPWKVIPCNFFKRVGGLAVFESNVNAKKFKGMGHIDSIFWKEVLSTWLDTLQGCSVTQTDWTPRAPLFNNRNVTVQGQTLFLPSAIIKGVVRVKDVCVGGRLATLEEFQSVYGSHPRSALDYCAIKSALAAWDISTMYRRSEGMNQKFMFKGMPLELMDRKKFAKMLNSQSPCYCYNLWKRKFDQDINETNWSMIFKSTNETRIQELSWKILHNIYPTSILLHKMKLKESSNCEHCNVLDTVEHFFYHCKKIKHLWKEIRTLLYSVHGIKMSNITEKEVILGFKSNDTLKHNEELKVNLLLSVGRLVISKFKYGKAREVIEIWETEIRKRKLNEKEYAEKPRLLPTTEPPPLSPHHPLPLQKQTCF